MMMYLDLREQLVFFAHTLPDGLLHVSKLHHVLDRFLLFLIQVSAVSSQGIEVKVVSDV